MLHIREAIVVEGRYDKNTLSQVVDTLILETSGFGIFKNPEQMALLRKAAQRRGLIVLTDSDGAGFVIRNRIRGTIPEKYLKHAYIPDIYGKEKRKKQGGREGKLGVEGMPPQVLEQALRRAGATFLEEPTKPERTNVPLTKADLFAAGLTGRPDSTQRRQELLKKLALPEHMSTNALLAVLNGCYSREEVEEILR
jgi:ribonuclease M5